ncbi:hypothetical protein F5Y14DRAFT_430504 [Nemania sp. NC0429]|nr:hypothetical protein F5Y14DRAFT_430504 [Nemania sp. NC0429]
MSNGSKKYHSKSRNGCGQCKRRRVRCNNQGPVCSNCHRRNEFCDYLRNHYTQSLESAISRNYAHVTPFELSHASHSMRTTTSVNDGYRFSRFANLVTALDYYPTFADERELLAYAASFIETDYVPLILSQDQLPPIRRGAYDHCNKRLGYLLPSISSLCAIHQATQQASPSSDAYVQAVQHNIAASASFRHAERSVHEGNWLPMLMFGVSHIMFNFAAAQSMPDSVFDYLSVFHVLRGTGEIGDLIGAFLEKSELAKALEWRRQRTLETVESDDILQAINQLGLAEHPPHTPKTTREDCQHALERLKWWAQFVDGAPQIWKHFILWPASVTDGFATALIEKQPVALLIYIYWCVVMGRAPRRWYADGWHQRVAIAAMSDLGPEYGAFLDKPKLILNSTSVTHFALRA